MQRKFFSKFIQLIAIVLNTQLIFAPVAIANDQAKRSFGDYAQIFSGLVGQATNSYVQARQGGMGGPDQVAMIEAQLAPMVKIKPVDQRQIPPVFSGCLVLPASGTEMTGNLSCEEATDQQVMSGYTEAIISLAKFNRKQLKNYQTKGHQRFTTQGVGCYEKKMEDFNGLLLAREEELSKLQNKLKERIEAFKLKSRNDLENIRKKAALLTGKPTKFLKDVRFDELFIGNLNDKDKVCASVFTKAMLSRAGKKTGLRGIEQQMFSKMTESKDGSYSPEEMITKAETIKTEIRTLSNALASRVSKRADLQVNLSSTALNSKLFTSDNKALEKVVKNFNNNSKEELTDLEKELRIDQAIKGDKEGAAILGDIKANDIPLAQRLADYERLNKKSCLLNVIKGNWGSASEFANGFKNPNVSEKMRKRADNSFATQIASEINNPNTTFEQIMAQVNQFQKQGLNSSKIMITGKSFSIRGKTISASTPLRANQLLGILTNNCKTEFDYQKNSKGFTRRDIVKKLQSYGNKVKTLRKTASSKLKSLLRNELIECKDDTSTGVTDNSCGKALNVNNPNFCVATAKKCADNYKGCYDKAQTFTKTTREEQVKLAGKYNDEVNKLKGALKKDLLGINQFMESQARSLDGQLRMGTVFQVNKLAFNLNEDFLYKGKDAQGLDEELNIEDPEKIMAMADKQLTALKKQLEGQRKEQMKKLADVTKGYKKNYKTQEQYWNKVARDCKKRNNDFDRADAERKKTAADTDAEINKACQEVRMLNYGVPCDEVGPFMSNIQEVMLKAPKGNGANAQAVSYEDQKALRQLQQIKRECNPPNNNKVPAKLADDFDMEKYCDEKNVELRLGTADINIIKACDEYKTVADNYPLGECTTDKLLEKLGQKKFCTSDPKKRSYTLSGNKGINDCPKVTVNEDEKYLSDTAYKDLYDDLDDAVTQKNAANAQVIKLNAYSSLTDEQKTNLEKYKADLKTAEDLIANTKNAMNTRKKQLDDDPNWVANEDTDSEEIHQDVLSSDTKNILSGLTYDPDDENNAYRVAGCYPMGSPPKEMKSAILYATKETASEGSENEYGEKSISLAMCNGNYEGMYDNSSWGGAANQAAGAVGNYWGARQE